jgi:hypothetical protein
MHSRPHNIPNEKSQTAQDRFWHLEIENQKERTFPIHSKAISVGVAALGGMPYKLGLND